MANFLSLPRELRDNIYEELLMLRKPVAQPWHASLPAFEDQALTLGLLRVNKTIHLEASRFLYSKTHFDFTLGTSEEITSFLDTIGHNASFILSISLNFPSFSNLDGDSFGIIIEDDSSRILEKIQSDCKQLATVSTSLESTDDMEIQLDKLDSPKKNTAALALVNTRFRAILSLQKVIVDVYEEGPSDHIRREMESLGWTIRTTQYVEEPDFDWDRDDDYDRYDDFYDRYDDESYDDYDIDNDSDFWRRAAD